MNIITFDENEEYTEKDYGYIESALKKYIEKTNFPKKLVLTELKNEIEKREKLELQIKEKYENMSKIIEKLDSEQVILEKENNKRIQALLNTFSHTVF